MHPPAFPLFDPCILGKIKRFKLLAPLWQPLWFWIGLAGREGVWYGNCMMIKIYWFFRIVAYVACLGGVVWFWANRTAANGGQEGLYAVYVGFLAFFVSYAIRFFIRFGNRSRREAPRGGEGDHGE